ncbi:DUF3732 domain-containing protein [Achromobacter denitrificans]
MHFQILEIILWPKSSRFSPRIVPLAPGIVNVINGASKRGKSSVIPIIDYCLGSRHCNIPAGKIRHACSWFGIKVQTKEGEKILARREPGKQQGTDDMFLLEGDTIQVPTEEPKKNTSRPAVKQVLDRLAGLSNLGFDPDGLNIGFQGRPSFRDTLAFCFQPQNIVANPAVLLYRADSTEHREKVRTIFPYVLGATSAERLALKWELENLNRQLRRMEREQAAYIKASEAWLANLRVWITEARELGLLTTPLVDNNEHTLLTALESIVSAGAISDGLYLEGSQATATEYAALQSEEARINRDAAVAQHRLTQISAVRSTVNGYTDSLVDQSNRLGISRWLRALPNDDVRCPVCDGSMDSAHEELNQLCDALAVVEGETHAVSKTPPILDRDLIEVTERLQLLQDQLKAVRIRKRAIEERSKEIREHELATAKVARFIGNVEQALKLFQVRDDPDGLASEIGHLQTRIAEIRGNLSEDEYQRKLEIAVTRVSKNLTKLASKLDIEEDFLAARIDINELTVAIRSESGRDDYLWQIGSGANWLSYHIAALLALHAFFVNQRQSPVPGLMIFDQPSQVYFPRSASRRKQDEDIVEVPDEDVQAIRKYFETMGKIVTHYKGTLQIIVLDHAGPNVWGGIDGVKQAEEWRDDNYLVPPEWFDVPN